MLKAVERLIKEGYSVQSACKALGVARSQFYKWRSRQCENSEAGLRDLWQRSPNHSANISEAERERILALALKFPEEGCDRIKRRLADEGVARSSTTVQNVLRKAGLGTQEQRIARRRQLNLVWRAQMQKLPSRRCRTKGDRIYEEVRSSMAPGERILQSFFSIVGTETPKTFHLHFIFDCATEWTCYSLRLIPDGVSEEQSAIALLRGKTLGEFYAQGVDIRRIATDNRAIFTVDSQFSTGELESSAYSSLLKKKEIDHQVFKVEQWAKTPYLISLLRRLKAAFADKETLARFIAEHEPNPG